MTGLIVLELMMMRQTWKVEGEQDVQYIDSWGEAGWRPRSALGSWSAKLLRFQTPSGGLIPRVVSKIPLIIGPNCQGKGRTRWRTKLRCRTMLLRGAFHQAVMATADWAPSRSLSSCHRAWLLLITA